MPSRRSAIATIASRSTAALLAGALAFTAAAGPALGASAPAGRARRVGRPQPGRHVPAASAAREVTARELLAVLFPAMKEGSDGVPTDVGATAASVRRFDSGQEPAVPYVVTAVGASVALEVPDGPETRHVLYVQVSGESVNESMAFSGSGNLVALFDDGPSPRLLDLVDVQTDRECDFGWGGRSSWLGPRTRSFLATNTHHNSSQGYHAYSVLYVHRGRIRELVSIGLLSWGTAELDVDEKAHFRVVPRRGSPFGDFVVTVTVDRRPRSVDGEPVRARRSVRTYREVYRWRGPGKGYVDAGGTLDVVQRLNEANY